MALTVAVTGVLPAVGDPSLVLSLGDINKTLPQTTGVVPRLTPTIWGSQYFDRNVREFTAGQSSGFAGTLDSRVSFHPDNDGPKLAFWYQLTISAVPSGGAIDKLSLRLPTTSTTAVVNQDLSASTVEASTASFLSSTIGGTTYSVLGIDYNLNDLTVGEKTSWVAYFSDYTDYNRSLGDAPLTVVISDGSVLVNLTGLGPVGAPVPEPETWAGLSALGLLAFAAYRRFAR